MIQAARLGNDSIVKALVEKGKAATNSQNKRERTALHLAASQRHLSTVNILLDKEADVDSLDDDGNSPLYISCQDSQNLAVVQALLNAGADVNILNRVSF